MESRYPAVTVAGSIAEKRQGSKVTWTSMVSRQKVGSREDRRVVSDFAGRHEAAGRV